MRYNTYSILLIHTDGDTEASKCRVDMMESVLIDFRNASIRLFYNPVFERLKANYLKELEVKLQQFEKFIGDNKFLTGDKVSTGSWAWVSIMGTIIFYAIWYR